MFDNILGQERAKKFIINSLNQNRISHGYIFHGPSGVGKKEFAIEFAKLMLNTQKIENSPDIKILNPEGAYFKVSQIRQITVDISVRPYSNKKIYILNQADKMTIQAQNALLKTLEEPPSYAVIILITDNIYSLLDTIKSRCEIVRFTLLPQQEIENYLIQKENIPKDRARFISCFSSGILSRALDFIYKENIDEYRNFIVEFINTLFKQEKIPVLDKVKDMESYKENIYNILDIMMAYFRDSLIVKEEGDEQIIINLDQIDFVKDLSRKLTYFQICKVIDIIDKTSKYIKSNCNFNLSLEVMALNIQEVIK
ncbi:DNA polymerase-3 subunit delta' [Alkalithermobacter thermoalcaliphilus JW-YL-7 = DSM 7308]|uniref:DNA polymerase III subunit delta' n=1 Tax=Alkalithermobacter thermoalcaliphilus JW-YL-7 = DSM 7308 TaxID=1121328 RepID=A0A150FSN8_CLOPD|nr:DNA polymerase III delta subunit [[Clostridium] paradoxum JW-YL-7 = DSM 7308]SHL20067.1 DNA polymerase-3 subunit delta' [[Clostridium] paradoxum JW-YL-7 = DSM 7308]